MHLNTSTVITVLTFSLLYFVFTARETARHKFDIYDFFMLSTLAILPTLFVIFPQTTKKISAIFGVAFPFVILFAALFIVLFCFLHKLSAKVQNLERQNRNLIQELGLLQLQTLRQNFEPNAKIKKSKNT